MASSRPLSRSLSRALSRPLSGGLVVDSPLLELYPGASAAYSLQDIGGGGNVIRARRSIDNSESDFSASDIGDPLRQFAMNDSSELLGYAKSGNRMYFDGSDDRVALDSQINLTGDFTLKWTSMQPSPTSRSFVFSNTTASYVEQFSSNAVNIKVSSGSSLTLGGTSTPRNAYQLYNFEVSRSGNTISYYLNDVFVDSGTLAGTVQISSISIDNSLLCAEGLLYDLEIHNDATGTSLLASYRGYGNTDSDWEDQVGSNDGTVNGSPALFTGQGFDAYVATWYDQSGNGQHATQTTASQQPIVINNGSVTTDSNGHATIEFDGSGDHFQMPFYAGSNSGYFITSIIQPNDNTTNQVLVDFADAGGDGIQLYGDSSGSIYARTNLVSASQNYDSDPQLFTGEYTGTDLTAYVDGVGGTTLSGSDTDATTNGRIGSPAYTVSSTWSGTISEMIIYLSDESANRSAIESNIIGRYG